MERLPPIGRLWKLTAAAVLYSASRQWRSPHDDRTATDLHGNSALRCLCVDGTPATGRLRMH